MRSYNKSWKIALIPSIFALGVIGDKDSISSRMKKEIRDPRILASAKLKGVQKTTQSLDDSFGIVEKIEDFITFLNSYKKQELVDIVKVTSEQSIKDESARAKRIATFIIEGRNSFEQQNYRDALLSFKKALEIAPQNITAQRFIRRIFQELPKIKSDNIDDYEYIKTEISKDPLYKDLVVYEVKHSIQKGLEKYKKGSYEASIPFFDKAVILDPKNKIASKFRKRAVKMQMVKKQDVEQQQASLYEDEVYREKEFVYALENQKSEILSKEEAARRDQVRKSFYAKLKQEQDLSGQEVLKIYSEAIYLATISNYNEALNKIDKVLSLYPNLESVDDLRNIVQLKKDTNAVLSEYEKSLLLAYYAQAKEEVRGYISGLNEAEKLMADISDIRDRGINEQELKAQVVAKKEEELRLAELASNKATIVVLLSEGKALYKDKKWDETISKFEEVLKLDPYNKPATKYIDIAKAQLVKEEEKKKKDSLFYAEKQDNALPYIVDVDDVVRITVLFHEEFSGPVTVGSDGFITLPLAGLEVKSAGLTEKQLAEEVSRKLERFVENPEVFVKVTEFNSKKIYVLGEIGSPGIYRLKNRDLTIRELMFMAGLPSQISALRRVQVIRQTPDGPVRKDVNVFDILYNGNLDNNILLKNGDIVYIPKRFTSKFTEVLSEIKAPFDAITDLNDSRADMQELWNQFREKVMKKPGGF